MRSWGLAAALDPALPLSVRLVGFPSPLSPVSAFGVLLRLSGFCGVLQAFRPFHPLYPILPSSGMAQFELAQFSPFRSVELFYPFQAARP